MSTSSVETVTTSADKAKLAASGLLVVAGVAAFYLLGQQSLWLRVLALLALVAAAVGVFFTSAQGKELTAFGQDAVKELRKVVWPTRPEHPDDAVRVRLCGGHGPVSLADRQIAGVGDLQPDPRLEAVTAPNENQQARLTP